MAIYCGPCRTTRESLTGFGTTLGSGQLLLIDRRFARVPLRPPTSGTALGRVHGAPPIARLRAPLLGVLPSCGLCTKRGTVCVRYDRERCHLPPFHSPNDQHRRHLRRHPTVGHPRLDFPISHRATNNMDVYNIAAIIAGLLDRRTRLIFAEVNEMSLLAARQHIFRTLRLSVDPSSKRNLFAGKVLLLNAKYVSRAVRRLRVDGGTTLDIRSTQLRSVFELVALTPDATTLNLAGLHWNTPRGSQPRYAPRHAPCAVPLTVICDHLTEVDASFFRVFGSMNRPLKRLVFRDSRFNETGAHSTESFLLCPSLLVSNSYASSQTQQTVDGLPIRGLKRCTLVDKYVHAGSLVAHTLETASLATLHTFKLEFGSVHNGMCAQPVGTQR